MEQMNTNESMGCYPAKKIIMWNIPLPFKRGLHLDMARGKHSYLEVGLYNWNSCGYSKLLEVSKLRRSDGVFLCVSIFGFTRYFRGLRLFTIQDLAGETGKLGGEKICHSLGSK